MVFTNEYVRKRDSTLLWRFIKPSNAPTMFYKQHKGESTNRMSPLVGIKVPSEGIVNLVWFHDIIWAEKGFHGDSTILLGL